VGKELVILQEVDRGLGIRNHLNGIGYESFSQGFTTRTRTTGVATYSSSKPVSECHLVSTEPLMRTPKATSITEYSLVQNDKTLLVVNVHAVNISWGLVRYRDQMDQIRQIITAHNGPAILSGDFNTWRPKRMQVVADMVSDLSFVPVSIDTDHRTRFYGNALDHVFVRGLTVENSHTQVVTSSDHNPISVELRL
jgi:endonuclease/exonuclease/phosphatase (EEP) superfamily protein YafD